MTKTTYKVGDNVRILNAGAIMACEAKDGDILKVIDVDFANEPVLLDTDGERLSMLSGELKYIEKVAEQVAKFKVGDKVEVTKEHFFYSIGDTFVINRIDGVGDLFDADDTCVFPHKVKLATQKPTKNQRLKSAEQAITALEQTVADLQAEVEALKAAQSIGKTAEAIVKVIEKHTPKSPNEQRKAIIAEAKAFVAENLAENHPDAAEEGVWFTDKDGSVITDKAIFHVNTKKRAVTCLIVDADDASEVYTKAIAKCAPDDVFNTDIGKAIALGRALGLDVSKFEQAVKPTEFANGQIINVKSIDSGSNYLIAKALKVKSQSRIIFEEEGATIFGTRPNFKSEVGVYSDAVILDDTEAQY